MCCRSLRSPCAGRSRCWLWRGAAPHPPDIPSARIGGPSPCEPVSGCGPLLPDQLFADAPNGFSKSSVITVTQIRKSRDVWTGVAWASIGGVRTCWRPDEARPALRPFLGRHLRPLEMVIPPSSKGFYLYEYPYTTGRSRREVRRDPTGQHHGCIRDGRWCRRVSRCNISRLGR